MSTGLGLMDHMILLWGKVLVCFSSIKSKYDYLARNQGFSPPAGRAVTFSLQLEKVQRHCIAMCFESNTQLKRYSSGLCSGLNRSEWVGRQNARRRVRFDKIFASFSSNGKGRASPAWGQKYDQSQYVILLFPTKKWIDPFYNWIILLWGQLIQRLSRWIKYCLKCF